MIFRLLLIAILGLPMPVAAASFAELLTCSVYQRMLVGHFKRARNMPSMAAIEAEKRGWVMVDMKSDWNTVFTP